jgi:deazaflavin-dependent oxidoreductase (nitroreductase family)
MNDFNNKIIEEFRSNNGRVGGQFGGMELLLLTTTGAKTGKVTTRPLAYSRDGEKYVIVASKGGAPDHPDWYYNLLAHPEVTVEVGSEKFQAKAELATDKKRDELYAEHAKKYPVFNDYVAKTTRVIPVFLLNRIP